LTAHTVKRAKSTKKNPNDPVLSKHDRDLIMIEERFKYFDFTIFEKYEGFKDPVTMTVGDPPDWVKPAFEGAEQGDILPIKRITTGQQEDDMGGQPSQWRGPNRSASTSNLVAATASTGNRVKYDQDPSWKRSSMGTIRKLNGSSSNLATPSTNNESSTSLSEEYALSLQGIRKKQSTRSFRERRERDRKSIQVVQHP
jgi:serine/threonine kinase 32